ncbi:MAG: helix-turn-helix transcriptional regulator [Dehalococcoidia bacterium]
MNSGETFRELTPRESEVLDLARRGYTNNEIAERLGITRNAVRFHLKEVHSKLETGSERSVLARRWHGLLGWLGVPAAKLGIPATVTAFAGAMAVGGLAVYQSLPADGRDLRGSSGMAVVDGRYPNGCPTEYYAGTMTLEDFAVGRSATLSELQALNPGLGLGSLPPGTIVKVPYDANASCAEAVTTPQPTGSPQKNQFVVVVTPGDGTEVSQASTRSSEPGDINGACAAIRFVSPAVNGQWFRLWLDGTEVTDQSTWVLPGTQPEEGKLCYAPEEGFAVGTHSARLEIGDPAGGSPPPGETSWSFVVGP